MSTELQRTAHKFDIDSEDLVEMLDQLIEEPSSEGTQIALSQTKRVARGLRSLTKALAQARDTTTPTA